MTVEPNKSKFENLLNIPAERAYDDEPTTTMLRPKGLKLKIKPKVSADYDEKKEKSPMIKELPNKE